MTGRLATWLGTGLGTVLLLAGVLGGTVTAEAMLVAAWLENLSAGAATVFALLRIPGGRLTLPANVQVSGIPVRTGPDGTRTIASGCAAGFFVAHFGLFTLVHGVFLAVAVLTASFGPGASGGGGSGLGGLSGSAVIVVVVAALLRALRRVDPRRAIAQAYAGLLPVHVGVLVVFSTAVDLDTSTGRGPALVVVGLLLVGDLIRAVIGRGRGDRSPAAVPTPPVPPPPAAPPPAPPPSAPPPPAAPPPAVPPPPGPTDG